MDVPEESSPDALVEAVPEVEPSPPVAPVSDSEEPIVLPAPSVLVVLVALSVVSPSLPPSSVESASGMPPSVLDGHSQGP